MSKTAKNSVPAQTAGAELPFEEAMKKLESVVAAMESDDLPLETMLAKYEEGMRLAEACQAKLAAAELKLQQLEKNAAGQTILRPLAAAETASDE
jgi:exodeoxyribonuclease VII small subunit